MKTLPPALKRWPIVLTSLALAALACARAESAIAPQPIAFATPLPGVATRTPVMSETPTETSIATEPSQATATEAGAYPGPGTETPTVESSPTPEASPTSESAATEATSTREAEPTATTPPTGGGIPPEATFTQGFSVDFEGSILIGIATDMIDGNTTTWASLRAPNAYWKFDLGSVQNVAGVRLYPRSDGNFEVALLMIEVSTDGATWTPVYTGQGSCGDTPACDILAVDTTHDIGFGPVSAQYVRMQGGPAPARFAFGEVQIAVMP
jgi:F5/8 type C domain-containing protein